MTIDLKPPARRRRLHGSDSLRMIVSESRFPFFAIML
jgi:hypothetical protein